MQKIEWLTDKDIKKLPSNMKIVQVIDYKSFYRPFEDCLEEQYKYLCLLDIEKADKKNG